MLPQPPDSLASCGVGSGYVPPSTLNRSTRCLRQEPFSPGRTFTGLQWCGSSGVVKTPCFHPPPHPLHRLPSRRTVFSLREFLHELEETRFRSNDISLPSNGWGSRSMCEQVQVIVDLWRESSLTSIRLVCVASKA